MKMDFYGDLADICKAELDANGYAPEPMSAVEMIRTYLSVLHRTIDTRKRQVMESKQLQVPPQLQAGYAEIKRKAEAGESLIPHQSRGLDDSETKDPLLNDWGVQHLHLGTRLLAHGYIERTGIS